MYIRTTRQPLGSAQVIHDGGIERKLGDCRNVQPVGEISGRASVKREDVPMRMRLRFGFSILIGVATAGLLLPTVQAAEATSAPAMSFVLQANSIPVPQATLAVVSASPGVLRVRASGSMRRGSLALGKGWKACLVHAWESNCARYA